MNELYYILSCLIFSITDHFLITTVVVLRGFTDLQFSNSGDFYGNSRFLHILYNGHAFKPFHTHNPPLPRPTTHNYKHRARSMSHTWSSLISHVNHSWQKGLLNLKKMTNDQRRFFLFSNHIRKTSTFWHFVVILAFLATGMGKIWE